MSGRTRARSAVSEPKTNLFAELKRRNIFRIAAAYLATAWLILHVGYVLGQTLELPKWAMRFVIFVLALGFPAALAFAWTFELTPHGIRRSRDVSQRDSIRRLTGRKLDFAIIAVLVVALGVVVVDAYVVRGSSPPGSAPAGTRASIAVLPFVDLTPEKDHEYFSDGISEELLNRLSKIERFKVAGRTSSFAFKGKGEDLRKIGEQLGVESILEGSVRKDADRIRVTAQLVNVQDGTHLWSETYDRQLKGIFEIQDDIARQVVSALSRTLLASGQAVGTDSVQRPTSDTAAYNSYLRGQYFLHKRTRKDMEQAIVEFERATTLDPSFALAHVGLSNANVLLASYGWRNMADVTPIAQRSISTALELDPNLAEAHAGKYLLLSVQEVPRKDRLAAIKHALELNPNDPQTLSWYAGELWNNGAPHSEGLEILERAYEFDPLASQIVSSLSWNLYAAGQHERAHVLAQELAVLTPGGDELAWLRAKWAWADGRPDERLRWLRRAVEISEDNGTFLDMGLAYEELGDPVLAARYYERAIKLVPSDTYTIWRRTKLHSCASEPAEATEMLQEALRRYPNDLNLKLAQITHEYCAGTTGRLIQGLKAAAPNLFDNPPDLDAIYQYIAAPYAVFATRQVGDSLQAEAIAASFYRFVEAVTPPGMKGEPDFMRARVAAALGDRGRVIKYLDKLYDTGSVLPAWVVDEPMFRPYAKDPVIAARLAKHAERRNGWRRALEAEGLWGLPDEARR